MSDRDTPDTCVLNDSDQDEEHVTMEDAMNAWFALMDRKIEQAIAPLRERVERLERERVGRKSV